MFNVYATPALRKRLLGPLDRKDLPPGYCMGPLYSGLGAIQDGEVIAHRSFDCDFLHIRVATNNYLRTEISARKSDITRIFFSISRQGEKGACTNHVDRILGYFAPPLSSYVDTFTK